MKDQILKDAIRTALVITLKSRGIITWKTLDVAVKTLHQKIHRDLFHGLEDTVKDQEIKRLKKQRDDLVQKCREHGLLEKFSVEDTNDT